MDPQHQAPAAERAYAAVDLGASSGRVVLGGLRTRRWHFEEVHRFANGVSDTAAGLAWDLEQLFEETLAGLRRAVERCAADGRRLSGIGVDSWGVDWVLVAPDGTPELPGLSYRGAPDPAPVLASRSLDPGAVYGISGIPDQAINTGLRLAARSASRDLADRQLLFIPDLWVLGLTGNRGSDPTIASTSQLLDPRTDRFSETLLRDLGLDGLAMPDLEAVGAIAGPLREAVRDGLGLPHDVPVFRVAGHDTAAAFAFADPARTEGVEALVSSGTWSLVGAAVREPITTEQAERLGFSNERGADGVLLLRNLTGLWMLQECLREWGGAEEPADPAPLLDAVERREFDSRTFDASAPELLGTGDMEGRLRTLCAEAGRPLDDSRESVVHAIIDSLAVTYAEGVRATEQLIGTRVQRVRIVGGGSRNHRLCRLTAELLQRPVIAGPTEASAIGNIAVQATADGIVASPSAVFDALAPEQTRVYEPRPDRIVQESRA
nr:FGGY-family carbohydrate kinase [Leucobacter weissii]